jgi:hypothetical protein
MPFWKIIEPDVPMHVFSGPSFRHPKSKGQGEGNFEQIISDGFRKQDKLILAEHVHYTFKASQGDIGKRTQGHG